MADLEHTLHPHEVEWLKPKFDDFIRHIAPVIKVAALEREADIPKNAIHYTLPHKGREQMLIPDKHYGAILRALCLRFNCVAIDGIGIIFYNKTEGLFEIMYGEIFRFSTPDEIKNYFQ